MADPSDNRLENRRNTFQRTLENQILSRLEASGLYYADRTLDEVQSGDWVMISGRISSTAISVWIYDDEAGLSGAVDLQFEREAYKNQSDLIADFLCELSNLLPAPEALGFVKLPIVINESREIRELGDLTVFESLADTELSLEVMDVENNEFFGFDAEGRRLDLLAENENIRISTTERSPKHDDVLRALLESALARNDYEAERVDYSSLSLEQLVLKAAKSFPDQITTLRQKKAYEAKGAILNRLFDAIAFWR